MAKTKKVYNLNAKKKYGQKKPMGIAKIGNQTFFLFGTKWCNRVEVKA